MIVPAQIIIGGITVLTDLNPWIVAFHLLVSMLIIQICVVLVAEVAVWSPTATNPDPDVQFVTIRRLRQLAWVVFAAGWLVLYLGTVVTGSGPHAGDGGAERTGLDPQVFSHVHAAAVYLLVALTVGLLFLARRAGATGVTRAAGGLLAVELLQGGVGFTQYYLDLPEGAGRAAHARRRAHRGRAGLGRRRHPPYACLTACAPRPQRNDGGGPAPPCRANRRPEPSDGVGPGLVASRPDISSGGGGRQRISGSRATATNSSDR